MSTPGYLRAALALFVAALALHCAHARATCSPTVQESFAVGNTDTDADAACDYNTIQDAIDASTCAYGTKIFLTNEVAYTATLALDTSTVSGNAAGYGGGINLNDAGGPAHLKIGKNTLIVDNTARAIWAPTKCSRSATGYSPTGWATPRYLRTSGKR